MSDRTFKILCIDGGGVRGIFAAKLLALLEEELGINLHTSFDLIVGTSTGSIIASAIVVNYDLQLLIKDYQEFAPEIFKKRISMRGIWRSKYDSKPLENFLRDRLGEIKLGEIEKPLILNATNASVGIVHVFKSSYQKQKRNGDYVRDGQVPLFKAVLASCAAPTYFDPVEIDDTLICDGGIWANNPALVGYTDALRNFKAKNVKVFSLGTGKSQIAYQKSRNWGFCNGWRKTQLVDFMMSCQTAFPANVLELVDSIGIFRINPDIGNYQLDNCTNIPTLLEMAKSEFTRNNVAIRKFFR